VSGRRSGGSRDVVLFTLAVLLVIVVVFFLAGYLLGRTIL